MKYLFGKPLAHIIEQKLLTEVKNLPNKIGLAFIRVGNLAASKTYIEMKKQKCRELGIESFDFELPENTPQEELHEVIESLNRDRNVHGILLQLPLPPHLISLLAIEKIDYKKDVDGFHPINMGKLALSDPTGTIPCTPRGIAALLHFYDIPIHSKNIIIIGRSYVVGRPLCLLLSQKSSKYNATVTLAHSASKDLKKICQNADIVISAVGNGHFLDYSFFAQGAVAIDVGITRVASKIVGDIDPQGCQERLDALSPVPGGVGPMTIAMLMQNTVECALRQLNLRTSS